MMERDPYPVPAPPSGDPQGENGYRILVVDDSTSERGALARILKRHGYEVDEAADGAAALMLIKRRGYDILLLDLHLPNVDGFEVLTQIYRQIPDLPVILLSGLPPDQIGAGLHRLPSGELPPLLLKPIDTNQLLQLVSLQLAGELP